MATIPRPHLFILVTSILHRHTSPTIPSKQQGNQITFPLHPHMWLIITLLSNTVLITRPHLLKRSLSNEATNVVLRHMIHGMMTHGKSLQLVLGVKLLPMRPDLVLLPALTLVTFPLMATILGQGLRELQLMDSLIQLGRRNARLLRMRNRSESEANPRSPLLLRISKLC